MRSLGAISFYLGCRIIRNRKIRELYLVQDTYINQLLKKYHMQDTTAVATLMDVNNKLQKAPDDYRANSNLVQQYQSLPTSQNAKFMNNPTQEHLDAAKRKSGRQPTVSQSSTEAEYISAALAAKEAAYIASLADELIFLEDVRPITIHGDNEGSIILAHKPIVDGRTKHKNVKYHFLRQQVKSDAINLKWVPTKDQSADGLTKPLFQAAHELFCDLIGLLNCTKIILQVDEE
ncbi:hypothetical protein K3495_g494 [Podosphaera aphanis]|nr:hypothetical protein K3495_g494 [Podosphaera aphanis]